MAMVGVVSGNLYRRNQPKSSGLVLGRRLLGAILHSSNEPGKLSQWLCHDDSTINIVVVNIIIIIITLTPDKRMPWSQSYVSPCTEACRVLQPGEFNGMSSQSHVSHCRVLALGEFTVMIPEPHATLQGAVTWRNQCHNRVTLQGVRIPSAIIENGFSPYFIFFCF